MRETIKLMKDTFEYCRSAAFYDDLLQHRQAFREAVKIVKEGDKSTDTFLSNIRNVSRSGSFRGQSFG